MLATSAYASYPSPFRIGISGKIEREPNDRFVVTVNRNHPETRRRFTVAHEIAHFVLHRDLIGDGIVNDGLYRSETLSDATERQANRYAADILMPWWHVTAFYREGRTSTADMARIFHVSVAVAEIRLRELAPALRKAQAVPA